MSLSKETEVIFDVRRGKDYDSANPPQIGRAHV